ncbi:MAG TPA: universal stress protein [Dermatophilaceae bacterium]|nr:universal stress protein [Dermatophilaceae bacterium]
MSGVLVGYSETRGGADALALGGRFARAIGSPIRVVMVLPSEDRPSLAPPSPAYERVLENLADEALDVVADEAPADTPVQTQIWYAEDVATGLAEAAQEYHADVICIGGGRHGTLGRVALGSIGNILLHSAGVPVGLAPRGSRHHGDRSIERVTVGIGGRFGAKYVIDEAIRLAARSGAPLRLACLVALRGRDSTSQRTAREAAQEALEYIHAHLPEGVSSTWELAVGDAIEDAAAELDWHIDEVAMVGSSRLAPPRRLFLGSVANKLLRVVPVPLVVVPRDHASQEDPR